MGGINKDEVGSSHGSLHHKAADLAVTATMELLEDIRVAVGDKSFLRYGPPSAKLFCDPSTNGIKTWPLQDGCSVDRAVTLDNSKG